MAGALVRRLRGVRGTKQLYGGGTAPYMITPGAFPRYRGPSLQAIYGPQYVKQGLGFPWYAPIAVGATVLGAGPLVGAGLGIAGGTIGGLGMNGQRWDPWVGVGGFGIGICPPGQRCIGGEAGGVCLGTCVPSISTPPPGGYMPPGTQPIIPAAGWPSAGAQLEAAAAGAAVCCPKGMRPNKSGYFTQGIKDGGGPRWVPPGTKCVSYRRTNPLNPKAASRAGRRLRSAAKAAKWLAKVQVPKRTR